MGFKKIALALFACLALGAFAANAAQAAEWTVAKAGGGSERLAGPEKVECHKHSSSETLKITTKFLGSPVEITAKQIDCVEATIDTTAGGVAHSKGKLTFTEVSVDKPALCHLPSDLTTEVLTDEVIMDPTAGSNTVADKFFPEVAGGGILTLTFEGAECPVAGTPVPVKGTLCGESVHTNTAGTAFEMNLTGELRTPQTLLFGEAQQSTFGCEMRAGNEKIFLFGAVDTVLAGANVGKAFGAD
jgi:hypothetical protein